MLTLAAGADTDGPSAWSVSTKQFTNAAQSCENDTPLDYHAATLLMQLVWQSLLKFLHLPELVVAVCLIAFPEPA